MHPFLTLIRHVVRDLRHELRFEFTGPQLEILELLSANGPKKMSDLADALEITLGGVTSLADRMCKAGLTERMRSSHDRRVVLLTVTDAGRLFLENLPGARSKVLERYFRGLSAEERELLQSLCEKMLKQREA